MLAWGTRDDIVERGRSRKTFLLALKQAGFYARRHSAWPHFWFGDPLDEAGSYSALFAARLLRF